MHFEMLSFCMNRLVLAEGDKQPSLQCLFGSCRRAQTRVLASYVLLKVDFCCSHIFNIFRSYFDETFRVFPAITKIFEAFKGPLKSTAFLAFFV